MAAGRSAAAAGALAARGPKSRRSTQTVSDTTRRPELPAFMGSASRETVHRTVYRLRGLRGMDAGRLLGATWVPCLYSAPRGSYTPAQRCCRHVFRDVEPIAFAR